MSEPISTRHTIKTARHHTAWIEAGPRDAPLMIFLHGWPELGLIWHNQIKHFAAQGWRCIAPDMRGYGQSSRPDSAAAYAVRELVAATLALLYRVAPARSAGARAITTDIRVQNGWFGAAGRALTLPRDTSLLSQEDFDALVQAFAANGFAGPNAWYMNDDANLAYAAEAPAFGKIMRPSLFIHATNDMVCDTARGRLAEPMREDCERLTEHAVEAGHWSMLERPSEVNQAICDWLTAEGLGYAPDGKR